jgi:hypothetical protein
MAGNIVIGYIIKYKDENDFTIKAKVINDYYITRTIIHIFILEDLIDKRKIRIRASELYKKAIIIKPIPKNQRALRVLEKKKKMRLARRGLRN